MQNFRITTRTRKTQKKRDGVSAAFIERVIAAQQDTKKSSK